MKVLEQEMLLSTAQPVQVSSQKNLRVSVLLQTLWLLVLCQALFASLPWIDLWVSSLFWSPQSGFALGDIPALKLFREFAKDTYLAMCVLALAGLLLTLLKVKIANIPMRVWGYIFTLYALGPGLLVNAVLKQHWGRGRPADVIQFGGEKEFSPPFELVSQCVKNCSFVSGEASGAAAFAISAFLLTRYIPNKAIRQIVFGTSLGLSVAGALLRIAFGRHFTSDVIFGALFVSLIAIGLAYVFFPKRRPTLLMPGFSRKANCVGK